MAEQPVRLRAEPGPAGGCARGRRGVRCFRAQLRVPAVDRAWRQGEDRSRRSGPLRRQHPRASPGDERPPSGARHAALLPASGGAVHGGLPRCLFQPARPVAAGSQCLRGDAQRGQERGRHQGREVRRIRPEETRLLDGDRQRQDADHAPELPAVPSLQQPAVGQHPPDHAQRGVERAAHRGNDRLGHPLPPLRHQRERPWDGRQERRSRDRDHQAGGREARRGRERLGRVLRREQPDLRGRGAQGFRRRGVAQVPRCAGSDRVHVRVQRHVRTGSDGRPQRRSHGGIREGHRFRLLLSLLPRGRLRQGVPHPEPEGRDDGGQDGDTASRQPAVVLRATARLPGAAGRPAAVQPGEASLGVRRQQRQRGLHRRPGEAKRRADRGKVPAPPAGEQARLGGEGHPEAAGREDRPGGYERPGHLCWAVRVSTRAHSRHRHRLSGHPGQGTSRADRRRLALVRSARPCGRIGAQGQRRGRVLRLDLHRRHHDFQEARRGGRFRHRARGGRHRRFAF